jgi:hypothetical protein
MLYIARVVDNRNFGQSGTIEVFLPQKNSENGFERYFQEDLKNFVHWGYVNINKTSKPDVFELQGAGNMKTKFHANESLFDFMVKLNFLKERKAIIDQWD